MLVPTTFRWTTAATSERHLRGREPAPPRPSGNLHAWSGRRPASGIAFRGSDKAMPAPGRGAACARRPCSRAAVPRLILVVSGLSQRSCRPAALRGLQLAHAGWWAACVGVGGGSAENSRRRARPVVCTAC
jgi:hypothetical protein